MMRAHGIESRSDGDGGVVSLVIRPTSVDQCLKCICRFGIFGIVLRWRRGNGSTVMRLLVVARRRRWRGMRERVHLVMVVMGMQVGIPRGLRDDGGVDGLVILEGHGSVWTRFKRP